MVGHVLPVLDHGAALSTSGAANWLPVIRRGRVAMEPRQFGRREAVLDARFGHFIQNVAGEAYNLPLDLTVEQLWLIADYITTDAPRAVWNRARRVRDGYRRVAEELLQGSWRPSMVLPDGEPVPPEDALTNGPEAALGWVWRGVMGGVSWLDAWRQGCAALVWQGFDWPTLPPTHQFRNEWLAALDVLRATGDASGLDCLVNEICDKERFRR